MSVLSLYNISLAYLAKNVKLVKFSNLPDECIHDLTSEIVMEKLGGSILVRMCDGDILLGLLCKYQPTSPLLNINQPQVGSIGRSYAYNSIDEIKISKYDFSPGVSLHGVSLHIEVNNIHYNFAHTTYISPDNFDLCTLGMDIPKTYMADHIIVEERHINDELRIILNKYIYTISKPFKIPRAALVDDEIPLTLEYTPSLIVDPTIMVNGIARCPKDKRHILIKFGI